MRDEDWVPDGRARWIHRRYDINTYRGITATITCVGSHYWHLFINTQYIATFNSWAEARDATPMMIALHSQGEHT